MLTEIHKGALQDGACPCSPLFHVQFFFPLLTLLTHSSPTPTTRKVSSIKQLPTDLPMRHPITGRAWLLWCLTGDPFSNHHSPPRPTLPQPLVNCARSIWGFWGRKPGEKRVKMLSSQPSLDTSIKESKQKMTLREKNNQND